VMATITCSLACSLARRWAGLSRRLLVFRAIFLFRAREEDVVDAAADALHRPREDRKCSRVSSTHFLTAQTHSANNGVTFSSWINEFAGDAFNSSPHEWRSTKWTIFVGSMRPPTRALSSLAC